MEHFCDLPGWRDHHEVPLVLRGADSNRDYSAGAGALQLLAKQEESRRFLAIASVAAFICAILLPAVLIGGCANPEMSCNVLTYPCVYAISVVGIIVQAINAFTKNSQR